MLNLLAKLRAISIRIILIFANFPQRLLRLVLHLCYPFTRFYFKPNLYVIIDGWLDWIAFIPFYAIDLLGISEFYEIINELINWEIRDIQSHEILMAKEIFKEDFQIELVRINSRNRIAKKLRIAYVSFRQINFSESIPNDVFVHELVHIWQYQNFGAVYIYKSWKAQISKEGYNYGSIKGLTEAFEKSKKFYEFNFEQQAEIIQDFYKAQFQKHKIEEGFVFEEYLNEMNLVG